VRDRFEIAGGFSGTGSKLDVYDVTGRRVAQTARQSTDRISWDLRTANGNRVPDGVYVYSATVGDRKIGGTLVVIRR
jgi:hypothetical protein